MLFITSLIKKVDNSVYGRITMDGGEIHARQNMENVYETSASHILMTNHEVIYIPIPNSSVGRCP